jgi:hypothetical protein
MQRWHAVELLFSHDVKDRDTEETGGYFPVDEVLTSYWFLWSSHSQISWMDGIFWDILTEDYVLQEFR